MNERQARLESPRLRKIRSVVVRKTENGYRFTAIASTDGKATDGLVIEKDAWDTKRYETIGRPVFFNHEYDLPIGRAERVWNDERGLMVDIELDMDDETGKAQGIARRIKAGLLNSLSIGFRVVERAGSKVTRAILDEISVVSMPADEGALIVARSAYAARPRPSWATDEVIDHLVTHVRGQLIVHQLATMPRATRDRLLSEFSHDELRVLRDMLPPAH